MFKPAENWRKSIWTKLIASGFIGLTIIGNIWLVERFSVEVPPFWLQAAFVIFAGTIFVSGAALGAERLFLRVLAADASNNDDQHDP